jgi:hypothetical protein
MVAWCVFPDIIDTSTTGAKMFKIVKRIGKYDGSSFFAITLDGDTVLLCNTPTEALTALARCLKATQCKD